MVVVCVCACGWVGGAEEVGRLAAIVCGRGVGAGGEVGWQVSGGGGGGGSKEWLGRGAGGKGAGAGA